METLRRILQVLVKDEDYRGAALVQSLLARATTSSEVRPQATGEQVADKPLVEPPQLADRIKDTDKEPFLGCWRVPHDLPERNRRSV